MENIDKNFVKQLKSYSEFYDSFILEFCIELNAPRAYGNYYVFPCGRVTNSKGQDIKPHRIVSRSGKEYLRIELYINKKRKRVLLHRLVASCFLGPVDGLEVNHKDRNPLNCHVINLEILTPSQNQKHWREDER